MTIHRFVFFLTLISTLLLLSCTSKQVGPSEAELTIEITSNIANKNGGLVTVDTFVVKNLKILSAENIGNSVEEKIVGRFTAIIETKKPLYKIIDTLENNFHILGETSPIGLVTPISIKYQANIKSRTSNKTQWHYDFDWDDIIENKWQGKPKAYYQHALVSGSSEEEEMLNYLQEERDKRAKERQLALEKRKRERAKFISSLDGTWKTSKPLFHDNRRTGMGIKQGTYMINYAPSYKARKENSTPMCPTTQGGGYVFTINVQKGFPQTITGQAYLFGNEIASSNSVDAVITVHPSKDIFYIEFVKGEGGVVCMPSLHSSLWHSLWLAEVTFAGHPVGNKLQVRSIDYGYGKVGLVFSKQKK